MNTKTFFTLLTTLPLLASQAHAAGLCNAGGADPLDCKSNDGKYEILVHPRFYWSTGVSQNGFCDEGYIKLNGIELNGPADGEIPATAALGNTSATTAAYGMNTKDPMTQKIVTVSTVISFGLSDAGKDSELNYGTVLVSKDQKRAKMILTDNKDKSTAIQMKCE